MRHGGELRDSSKTLLNRITGGRGMDLPPLVVPNTEGFPMLVLSRDDKQTILIGKDIRVTVLKSRSGKVSLGIEAPRDMPVDREEVRIRKDSEAA